MHFIFTKANAHIWGLSFSLFGAISMSWGDILQLTSKIQVRYEGFYFTTSRSQTRKLMPM